MEKNPSQDIAPELAKAREAMGEDEAQEIIDQESQPDEKDKKENEPESESEKESESESDEEDDKEEDKEEEEGEEKKDDKDLKSKSNHSAKPSRPLKAVFTQMKELRQAISVLPEIMETLKTLKNNNPVKENVDKKVDEETSPEVRAIAEELGKKGFDTNGVEELISAVLTLTKKEKAVLPKDIQDKLKILDDIKAKEELSKSAEADAMAFNKEWDELLPNLMKEYPNADKKLLDEAKVLLDKIAHSEKGGVRINDKTIKGYPLDFIIYQNKKDFDNLLKVAKKGKNIESSNKEFVDVDDESEIDLDPSNMTPEKYKKAMSRKVKENVSEDIQVIG